MGSYKPALAVIALFALLIALGALTSCSSAYFPRHDNAPVPNPRAEAGRSIAIEWIAPTQREDGTDLPENQIGAYDIYYGTSADTMEDAAPLVRVDDPPLEDAGTITLGIGHHCFKVLAIDTLNNVSLDSNIACVDVEAVTPPDPPEPEIPTETPPPTSFLIGIVE